MTLTCNLPRCSLLAAERGVSISRAIANQVSPTRTPIDHRSDSSSGINKSGRKDQTLVHILGSLTRLETGFDGLIFNRDASTRSVPSTIAGATMSLP